MGFFILSLDPLPHTCCQTLQAPEPSVFQENTEVSCWELQRGKNTSGAEVATLASKLPDMILRGRKCNNYSERMIVAQKTTTGEPERGIRNYTFQGNLNHSQSPYTNPIRSSLPIT